MKESLVKDWMTPDPIIISPMTKLPEAHILMKAAKVRRLLVVEDGVLVGVVTRGDIRDASPGETEPLNVYELNFILADLAVENIMGRDPVTIEATATIGEATTLMLEHKISSLPVLDQQGVVGIITESDIFRVLASQDE